MNTRIGRATTQRRLVFLALAGVLLGVGLATAASSDRRNALDRTFSSDGRKLLDFFGRRDAARGVAIQSDGKVLAAGQTFKDTLVERPVIARLRRDGSLDRSFAGDGARLLERWGPRGAADAIALQENGRIIVAGDDSGDLAVARVLPRGRLDRSFGRRGTVTIRVEGVGRPRAIAIQPDGKVVVVGHRCPRDELCELILTRLTRSGRLDPSFAAGGVLSTRFGEDAGVLGYGVALQDDGKIVVSGEIGFSWMVARFLPDGSPDAGFGNMGGFQVIEPILGGQAFDVALQPDGRIVAVGLEDLPGVRAGFSVARYLEDGSPDPTFGQDGAIRTAFDNSQGGRAAGVALQRDGRIVVGGTALLRRVRRNRFPESFAIARYRPNGRLDPTFSGDGKQVTRFFRRSRKPHDEEVAALAMRGRKIVLAGSSNHFGELNFALARYRK